MKVWNRGLVVFFVVLAALFVGGCAEEETGSSGGSPNTNYNWPADIIGYEIQFTVVDAENSGMDVGNVVRYTFDSNGSVRGYNPKEDQWYTPESYYYDRSGHKAEVLLTYYGGAASETYTLTAISEDGLEGNYDYTGVTGTGTYHNTGTYKVLTTNASTGNSSEDNTQNTATGTGKLTIYNLNGKAVAPISVYVDGSYVASFRQYYTDSGPANCDVANNEATVTLTKEAGTYTIRAADSGSASWGPKSVEVTDGGCALFGLY